MTLPIQKYLNPLLKLKSGHVKSLDDTYMRSVCGRTLQELIDEMFGTMYMANGVGLAAVQVGYPIRLCVIDTDPEHVFKDSQLVLINPNILDRKGEKIETEGCLSLPGVRCQVNRAAEIRVSYMNQTGRVLELVTNSLLSRAIQHEIDHMDGILILDRIASGTTPDISRTRFEGLDPDFAAN